MRVRHIIPISGKDSLATALVQTAREPDFDYEYVFNPTGWELPEVYDWLKKVEVYLGKKILRVGRDLSEIVQGYNFFLPSGQARYCTRQSKIEPFVEYLNGEKAFVYYGIRADENRGGFDNATSPNITPVYPLQELGIGLEMVYTIISQKGLKPPTFYWKELHEKVTRILGYDPKPLLPEWVFDRLMAWRSRANCDKCYNQRKYEWVGLLVHYPERYWEGSKMESIGSEGFKRSPKESLGQIQIFSKELLESLTKDELEGKYTFCQDQEPLEKLAKRANSIFQKRAEQVAKSVLKVLENRLFEDDSDKEITDYFAVTSCGLFCGK